MLNKKIYEIYHKKAKLQKHVIESTNFTYRNLLQSIKKYIPNNGRILDVGSATGTLSFYFASKGLVVDGVELSKTAVKYAKLNKFFFKLNNVNFFNKSIESYKTNNEYDLVTCFEVLEHLRDDVSCIKKLVKIMNKKSFVAISVPSVNAPLYRLGLLTNFDNKVGHLRRYSVDSLTMVIKRGGLKVVETVKTEGLLRNILFTNNLLGVFIKLTRFKLVNNFITFIDKYFLNVFGESQIIMICTKI